MSDIREIVESICIREEWPESPLTLDEQIAICNDAADYFVELGGDEDPEEVMDEVNSFALWLGGLDRNIQVYAWQLIRRDHGITVYADDKTGVRLQPLEDKIFEYDPYEAETYEEITKFKWPREYADGSTFEDRLEALAEDLALDSDADTVTADMVLSGLHRESIEDIPTAYALVNACVFVLKEVFDKYAKRTIIYDEKLERYLAWLDLQSSEMAELGRGMLNIQKLPYEN